MPKISATIEPGSHRAHFFGHALMITSEMMANPTVGQWMAFK